MFKPALSMAGRRFPSVSVAFLALATFTLGSPTAAADQPDAAPTASEGSESPLSERQRRREERRQDRQQERQQADSGNSPVAAAPSAAGGNEPETVIVVVEPEMECRRVAVVGSRVPKEVCTPVVDQTAMERHQEESAEEFLRRVRALQTRVPQDDGFSNPSPLSPSGF